MNLCSICCKSKERVRRTAPYMNSDWVVVAGFFVACLLVVLVDLT